MIWSQSWWTKSAAQPKEIMRWAMKTSQRKSRQHWRSALRLEKSGRPRQMQAPESRELFGR
jgi:hypothetical protein